jgi:hypothetical protein
MFYLIHTMKVWNQFNQVYWPNLKLVLAIRKNLAATVDENFLKTPEREGTNPKQGRSVPLLLKEQKWRNGSTPNTICQQYTSGRKMYESTMALRNDQEEIQYQDFG